MFQNRFPVFTKLAVLLRYIPAVRFVFAGLEYPFKAHAGAGLRSMLLMKLVRPQ
jgi:hypothetical protein